MVAACIGQVIKELLLFYSLHVYLVRRTPELTAVFRERTDVTIKQSYWNFVFLENLRLPNHGADLP